MVQSKTDEKLGLKELVAMGVGGICINCGFLGGIDCISPANKPAESGVDLYFLHRRHCC
ncbi:hypothetical protein BMS3Abin06_02517 [bacterium BMS3Abin06]|nr:hypothetical protein BMS3Abin06_02517 [bacterium BMS3Abin06]